MQVIVIESVEALAIQIERELIKHSCDAPVVDSIISCLHPTEVPSDAGEVVNAIILLFAEAQVGQTEEAIAKAIAKAAALIESYSRRVPRAMLEELWKYCTTDHGFNPGECPESEIIAMSKIAAKYGYRVE